MTQLTQYSYQGQIDPYADQYSTDPNVAAYQQRVEPFTRAVRTHVNHLLNPWLDRATWSEQYGAWYNETGWLSPVGDTFWSDYYQAFYSNEYGWLSIPLDEERAGIRYSRIKLISGGYWHIFGMVLGVIGFVIAIQVLPTLNKWGAWQSAVIPFAALLVPIALGFMIRGFARRNQIAYQLLQVGAVAYGAKKLFF